MRILHVSAQKPDSTGSGVYLMQLVRACARLGCEQAVVCGLGAADAPEFPQGVDVFPVRFEGVDLAFSVVGMSDVMPYRSVRYRDMTPEMLEYFCAAFARKLHLAVEALRPDVILCHHLYLVCALVRELFPDVCVVGLSHGSDLRQILQNVLERDRIRADVCRLDRIFALNEAQAQRIREIFALPDERIRVVGSGYDARVFSPDPDVAQKPSKPKVLLYTGKIARAKGLVSLMHALEAMQTPPSDVELRLAGASGSRSEYEPIEKLAQDSRYNVHFLGQLAPEELAEQYRQAHTFVLPSFYEGLPLVVPEALACGCNVVLSDLPGVKAWLETYVAAADVDYVSLPRLRDIDRPFEEDLPAFEVALAEALDRALAREPLPCDTSALSWDSLAKRFLAEFEKPA